jgi:hypothetical protein
MKEEKFTIKELYELSIQQIEYEQELVNNRLSWMLTFQGFLFGSLAIVASSDTIQAARVTFKNVIPSLGILVSVLAILGVYASSLSIDVVRRKWKKYPDVSQCPLDIGVGKASVLARVTSYGIPSATILAWLLILLGLGDLS